MVDFNFTDEQTMLSESARSFLMARCPLSAARALQGSELGYSPDLWQEMADLDWLRLGLSPEKGGAGGGLIDLALIYVEMGRTLASSPHLWSAVVARTILASCGESAATELLPQLLSGEVIVIPVVQDLDPYYSADHSPIASRRVDNGYHLNGTRLLVPYANAANYFVVAAETGEGRRDRSLFVVDTKTPGIELTRLPNIADHALFSLTFDSTVPSECLIGPPAEADIVTKPALDRAYVLRSAEIAGAGERLLEMSVGYANTREQFGTVIGRFQAVQYLCSDIAIDSYLSLLFSLNAAALCDLEEPFSQQAHMAKAYASRASRRMAHRAHEVFAGAAFMIESDVPLFTWMAKHWEYSLGNDLYHRRRVTASMVADRLQRA
jgi:alkylation response protein AidB-like acyl-CoA dehydrogenase